MGNRSYKLGRFLGLLYSISCRQVAETQAVWLRFFFAAYHKDRDKSEKGEYLVPQNYASRLLTGKDALQIQIARFYFQSDYGKMMLYDDIRNYLKQSAFTPGKVESYINTIRSEIEMSDIVLADKEYIFSVDAADSPFDGLVRMCYKVLCVLI